MCRSFVISPLLFMVIAACDNAGSNTDAVPEQSTSTGPTAGTMAAVSMPTDSMNGKEISAIEMGGKKEDTPTVAIDGINAGAMATEPTSAGQMSGGALSPSTTDTGDVAGMMQDSPAPPDAAVTSCEEFGAEACFANRECPQDAACLNVGTENAPVSCCTRGVRGSRGLGELCNASTGQEECASSICISVLGADDGLCSEVCAEDVDCPANMPRCIPIAFSGSDAKWCFPPE